MAKLKYKLEGFTLVETIISLILIMSVFAIGLMIMINIMKSDQHKKRMEAVSVLSEVYSKTIAKKRYFDETITHDEYTIIKKFNPYKSSDRLTIMIIEIKDRNEKIWASRNELLLKNSNVD